MSGWVSVHHYLPPKKTDLWLLGYDNLRRGQVICAGRFCGKESGFDLKHPGLSMGVAFWKLKKTNRPPRRLPEGFLKLIRKEYDQTRPI